METQMKLQITYTPNKYNWCKKILEILDIPGVDDTSSTTTTTTNVEIQMKLKITYRTTTKVELLRSRSIEHSYFSIGVYNQSIYHLLQINSPVLSWIYK